MPRRLLAACVAASLSAATLAALGLGTMRPFAASNKTD